MRTTLAFVCAVLFGACAWGEGSGSGTGDDTPSVDAAVTQTRCGDGVCASSEVGSCTADCGGQTNPVCNNGACETGETTATCPNDCPASGPICGDAVCNMAGGENSTNCPGDCTGGGGALDCNDQNTLLACFPCLIDPTACAPPTTAEACAVCFPM